MPNEAMYQRLIDMAIDLLAVCTFEGHFIYLNPAWSRTLGWTRDELATKPFMDFVHPDDLTITKAAFAQLLAGDDLLPVHGFANRYRTRTGVWRWLRWSCAVDMGAKLIYCTAHDVTDSKAAENDLRVLHIKHEELVRTDVLTGLMNRRGGLEVLGRSMAAAKRGVVRKEPYNFCAALIDVDFFKQVNDTHGHLAGDGVLVQIAQILQREIRGSDALCRWGGEEFLVLLAYSDHTDGKTAAERLRMGVKRATEGQRIPVTISIGVSAWQDGDNADILVGRADAQLYVAKAAGRNCVR